MKFILLATLLVACPATNGQPPTDSHRISKTSTQPHTVSHTYSPKDIFVARVIYSEAGPGCSLEERKIVHSTIINRINHIGFNRGGTIKTAFDSVRARNAYSCINDKSNSNWWDSAKFTASTPNPAWQEALTLAKSIDPAYPCLYYHDASIRRPPSWDNKTWVCRKILSTGRLTAYTVTRRKRK